MRLDIEIKRKLFHHLSLVYLLVYAIFPRWFSLVVMTIGVLTACVVEFLRLRRPELNARLLSLFGGIHRESEIMALSGIFWTLLGCWTVMVVFVDRVLGVTAIGFLVFGDTAAALIGQAWGSKHWIKSPDKTHRGTYAFALVSFLWAVLFVRIHGAIFGALVTAYLESRRLPGNDNFWIPLGGASAIALCFGARYIPGNVTLFILPRVLAFCLTFFLTAIGFQKYYQRTHPQASLIDKGDLHG